MMYDHVGSIRDPLKQDLALEFCRNQNKVISILTETHINHDQIHHIRNNWLGPIFFSPGDSHKKGLLLLLHWVLKVSLRLTLIQKGRLCPLRLLPLMTEFCVYAPSGNSWLGSVSLKDYKIIWDFIDPVPIMPYQNSSWIIGLRIYGEGRTQITQSSPATIGPLARIQDRQGLCGYKNC